MDILILWTYFCNIFDYIYTLEGLKNGTIIEGNPVMNYIFKYPALAFTYKVIVVGLALLLLYHYREKTICKMGLILIALCYTILLLYEIICIVIYRQ